MALINVAGLHNKTRSERIFLTLNPKWALGNDDRQWIIYRWRGGTKGWRPRAFVATSKMVLRRVLGELGVNPTQQAKRALDHFPENFKKWRSECAEEQ